MKKFVAYKVFLLCLLLVEESTAQQSYKSSLANQDTIFSALPSERVFLAPISGCTILSGVINKYTSVTQISVGRTSITVTNASDFSKDDQVLFVQMQGAQIDTSPTDNHGTIFKRAGAGNYEYAIIKEINGNTISFTQPLSNRVYHVEGKIQLIRVPEYNKAIVRDTLTCPPWDGTTGGIVALSAQCLLLEGHINVAGKGFRGGSYRINPCSENKNRSEYATPDPCYSAKGEGVAGFGVNGNIYGRGAVANGGGGGNPHNGGGGGGGNINGGGKGGYGYVLLPDAEFAGGFGAKTLPPPEPGPWDPEKSNSDLLFLGGGGGSGQINDGHGSAGGNGGGIVIIRAGSIINTDSNSINVSGSNAEDDYDTENPDGCGGGGGAGAILLDTKMYINTLYNYAYGGDGGSRLNSTVGHGTGGGGSGGHIVYDRLSDRKGKLNAYNFGGKAGTALEGGSYGAQPGPRGPFSELINVIYGQLKPVKQTACQACELEIEGALSDCNSTEFTVRDIIYPLQEVKLDLTQSFNTKLQILTSIPSNEVNGLITLIDTTKPGTFELQAMNADGIWATKIGQIYPFTTPVIEAKAHDLIVVNSQPGDSFQWFLNDSLILNATNSTYTASATGEYYVEVVNTHGCRGSSEKKQLNLVGLAEYNQYDQEWIISPNPFSDIIAITGTIQRKVNIEISTIVGIVLWSKTYNDFDGIFTTEVNSKLYPSGVYYITITNGIQKRTFKIVKH